MTAVATKGAAEHEGSPRRLRPRVNADYVRERGVYIALLALILYNVLQTPHWNSFGTVQTLMAQVPATLLVSLGMLIVIGTGGIDLSVGAIMAISSATLGIMLTPTAGGGMGAGFVIAVIAAVLAGLAVGLFNGMVVAVFGVQPIVATLSLLVAGRGIALVITSGGLIELFSKPLTKLGRGQFHGVPYIMLIAALAGVVIAVTIRLSAFGYRVLAVGGNRRASVLAGVPVRRTLITVYAVSGVLSAIAGIIGTSRLAASDPSFIGVGVELTAITAVVVGGSALAGGRVRILGTFAGVVLMQMLVNTLTAHVIPRSVSDMTQAVIIVAAVYVQRTSRSAE